ncbi:MAG: (E)-4-hydroxy-3-methylbut-2-enyl-diphosphate synthase [Bacteroidales bacterium]|nr:(E)-4-hydroxy-3-methylbut-2-enyl-diphosphate synthase [Bacteroidales bacterium]
MYKSRSIPIGNLTLGGDAPVRIQSMTNTRTGDVTTTVDQCKSILEAGADLVRVTVRNLNEADKLSAIKEKLTLDGYHQPLVADVHFNPDIAFKAAVFADKVRINPGNFGGPEFKSQFLSLIDICKKHKTAIRIGVNHGSLSERIMNTFGDSPEGMVESAMEYLRICKENDFEPVVVSIKSSNTRTMIHANRFLVQKLLEEEMDYPIHLGITEAGAGEDGRMRSAVGIGTLLTEGIGDTIRVSLTERPENEIPFAIKLADISSNKKSSTGLSINDLTVSYRRRKSNPAGIIGNNNPPVVIASIDPESGRTSDQFQTYPDLIFDNKSEMIFLANDQLKSDNAERITTVRTIDFLQGRVPANKSFFIHCLPGELNNLIINALKKNNKAILTINHSPNDHSLGRSRLFDDFFSSECHTPVILKLLCREKETEDYMIHAAIELGGLFVDGLPDGIWLENENFSQAANAQMAFNLLQASRARMSKTEYIACPSCGRTLFNIENVLTRVQEATSHLKHLKIAVMGCIVNGPGEMADADYGYVGSGRGKITLYKIKDPVKKNIPEDKAIEELIHLIKENNDWIEPD